VRTPSIDRCCTAGVVLCVIALSACSGKGSPERTPSPTLISTPWRLVSTEAETLFVEVAYGGCVTFDHLVAREGQRSVTLTALSEQFVPPTPHPAAVFSPMFGCSGELSQALISLRLHEALGTRRLLHAMLSPDWTGPDELEALPPGLTDLERAIPNGQPVAGSARGRAFRPYKPRVFYATTTEGGSRIAVVSAATGKVLRYLTEAQPGGGPSDLTLNADRNVLYFARGDGSCAGHLARVPIAGGEEKPFLTGLSDADGSAPERHTALRSTGTTIAFARANCEGRDDEVVIATLGSDPEVRTTRKEGGIQNLVWQKDGTRLLVYSGGVTRAYSVDRSGRITGTHPFPEPIGCHTSPVVSIPTQTPTLLANRTCGVDAQQRVSIVELDGKSYRKLRTLVSLPRGWTGGAIALDDLGGHLLYSKGEPNGREPGCMSAYCPTFTSTYYDFFNGASRKIVTDPPYKPWAW
jgi:hypothetical protein